MNISPPDRLREFVEEQVRQGGYDTAGDYLSQLVREDQQTKAKAHLELELLAALGEGEAEEATPEWWAKLTAEVESRSRTRRFPED